MRYETGRYENTSCGEFIEITKHYSKEMLGRKVNITVYARQGYQSNRKDGLARKEEASGRSYFHFGDEQDRGANSRENISSYLNDSGKCCAADREREEL